jgi:hypothetical protein
MVVLRHVDWRRRRLKGLRKREVVGEPSTIASGVSTEGVASGDGHRSPVPAMAALAT